MTSATNAALGLSKARRVVVKIGSILLADEATGEIRGGWLDALCADLATLRKRGADVVVVSSGAIAIGRHRLGLTRETLRLEEKQAAAAAGQIRLAHAWEEALARFETTVAQVLLTLADTEERRRHLNARSTIETLLRLGAIPVINENDTVATEEIRFGDNDRLAARVAQMIGADLLVLLSDIDGLYSTDPGRVITKLEAAKIAQSSGCAMIIADGKPEHALNGLAEGARCTWFATSAEPRTARKRWIAGSVADSGAIIVDDGAVRALGRGKSLLPAGVVAVEGDFDRGDTVAVRDAEGRTLGRGLVAYAAADARRILGHKSREIEALLGYRGRDEMIHRDDLVLD